MLHAKPSDKITPMTICRTAAAVALLAGLSFAQQSEIRRENIEWTDVWFPNSNSHDLPRVLLIGDSITRAYFPAVEKNLQGKAYCARIATSKAIGDPALLTELATLMSEAKFDVVHFNIGMHGWAYTEDEYRAHLPELLATIRRAAPGARLIWASTTPVRKDKESGPSNTRIADRNRIARNLFTREGIPSDDLGALMLSHSDLHSDDVHFNAEGSAMIASQVADAILKALPPAM